MAALQLSQYSVLCPLGTTFPLGLGVELMIYHLASQCLTIKALGGLRRMLCSTTLS
jgi:hypothetical protein